MKTTSPNEEFYAQVSWYAIYTRHQHEKVVANVLTTKGFEVFLPVYTARHQWKDRTKELSLPLFPSYVFVHTCLRERVEVLRTPGVYQFVEFGGVPCPISLHEVQAVRRAIDHSLAIVPHPYLHCGDRVRVRSGPLTGSEGILLRVKSQYRLVLSIDILNRSVAVEVELSEVERLAPTASIPVCAAGEGVSLR
jgi:transcription antitermination factor NusG